MADGDRARDLADKVGWLSRPDAYPDGATAVEVVETHMAYVFLTDHHAWKLKKPVCLEFLDFSTLAARYRDGLREVHLNRRLAHDIYLGLVPLVRRGDAYSLGGEGPVADWLVKMRRLPASAMLDRRIAMDAVRPADVDDLTEVLTAFYASVPPEPVTGGKYLDWMRRQVETDCNELRRGQFALPRTTVESVRRIQRAFLREHAGMLTERARCRRIVEAHGDLRPEHVCLASPRPLVIDCLEFSRPLRVLDAVDELAFFALECERLGAAWIGERVLAGYRERTGDHAPAPLVAFYRRLRACLRAKLAVWHLLDTEVRDVEKWTARAGWYLRAACVREVKLSRSR